MVARVIFRYIFFLQILNSQFSDEKLYLTIQMMDQVGIINTVDYEYDSTIEVNMQTSNNSMCMNNENEIMCNMSDGCEWIMDMCMDNNNIDTPHFIVMDEESGYWFVSTIASGYIAQYSLIDNQLIDTYFIGDAPSILAIDIGRKKVYCSRMMPMNGMGNMMPNGESNIIQSISYSHMGLFASDITQYEINSPAPHGLAISPNGNEIFTASNTADWIYKINTETGEIHSTVMDSSVGNSADQTIQRLKPIQCLVVDDKLFVSCSSGPWYNPFSGETTIIPGSLQLWDIQSMELINSIDLGDYTSPWHIKESPIDNLIYVSLAGDNLYDTGGIACIRYTNEGSMQIEWTNSGNLFDTPHGIDVSEDGNRIYISDRGNGNIYQISSDGQTADLLFIGSMSMLGGISLTKKSCPNLGDTNNDAIINIIDIINIVNTILNSSMLDPYPQYASDVNSDNIINVSDIIAIVNIIIN